MAYEFMITDELIENLLIKKLLTDKQYMILLSDIFDKRWFDDDKVKKIIEILIKYYKKYDKLTKLNVLTVLIEKLAERDNEINLVEYTSFINDSVSITLDLDEKCIEDHIIQFIKNRGSYFAISDSIINIEKHKDSSKCIDLLTKFDSLSLDSRVGLDLFMDQDRIWDELLSDESRLPFLMSGFDKITNGGVYASGKALICLLAKTNLGKSLFLSNFTKNYASQGKNVLVITLEMSEIIYSKRMIAHISEDCIDTLKKTAETSKQKFKDICEKNGYGKIIIKEFAPKSITVRHIENELDKLKLNGIKIDAIVLDYLSLLNPTIKCTGSSYEDVGRISEEVRALSYKYTAPVITVCQTNRTGYDDSEVDLSSISESAKIAMTADLVISFWQDEEHRSRGMISGRVLKNRFGGYIGYKLEFKLNPYNLIIESIETSQCDDIDKLIDTSSDVEDISENDIHLL